MKFFELEDIDSDVVFRDVVSNALLAFLALLILIIPMLNPPKEAGDIESPGNLIVDLYWDDNNPVDVDLYLKAPDDKPVYYKRQNGAIFNLLRDDMGWKTRDLSNRNYETAFSRGLTPGEYIINVHLYDLREGGHLPVSATVVVSMKKDKSSGLEQLFSATVVLSKKWQEATVVRFTLDTKNKLLKETMNQDYYRMVYGTSGD